MFVQKLCQQNENCEPFLQNQNKVRILIFFYTNVTKHQVACIIQVRILAKGTIPLIQILLQGMDFWRVLLHSKQLHRLYVRGSFRLQPRGHRHGQVGHFI